jgi:hypothetical protein
MAFVDDFRERVIPEMRTEARRQALFMATGSATYSQAHAEVMGVGIDRGALRLPDADFHRLQSWAHDSLSRAFERVEPQMRAAEKVADRVGNEIENWLSRDVPERSRSIEHERSR